MDGAEATEVTAAAVENGSPNGGALGEASRHTRYFGADCSATAIAPSWLLTAGHCVAGWRTLPGGSDYDACAINPSASQGTANPPPTQCGDFVTRYDGAHDIALVHVGTPLDVLRTIAPPRVCGDPLERARCPLGNECAGDESCIGGYCVHPIPIAIRGFGGGSDDLPLIHGFGYSSHGGEFLFSRYLDGALITGGDSGGTVTVAPSDDRGPVVAVTGFMGLSNGGAFVWEAENIDWIWSVLDPAGGCAPGGVGGCAIHEPYVRSCIVGADLTIRGSDLLGTTLDITIDGARAQVPMNGIFNSPLGGFVGDINTAFPCAVVGCPDVATFVSQIGELPHFQICSRRSAVDGEVVVHALADHDAAPLMGIAGRSASGADACGDGRCTPAESPASCAVDCRPLPDADADGLPDVRDLCPQVPLRSGTQHADSDHDFIGDECEASAACEVTCGDDLDYDGQQDDSGCDNCPGLYNPDQADCDGDGQGDACDPDDADGDGVTDQCDNCASARNPSQANCNIDSELAGGACDRLTSRCVSGDPLPVGDACDPNPCGYTRVDVQSESLESLGLPSNERYLVQERIRMQGVVHTASGADVLTPVGFRYCRCELPGVPLSDTTSVRRACSLAGLSPCAITSTRVGAGTTTAPAAFDGTSTTTAYAWRRMTPQGLIFGGPARHHQTTELLRPLTTDASFDWALASDVVRWRSPPYLDAALVASPPSFPGVLWTHEPSYSGAGSVRELRSHYESGPFAAPRFVSLPPSSDWLVNVYWPIDDCHGDLGGFTCLPSPTWGGIRSGRYPWGMIADQGAVDAAALYPSVPMFEATDLAWTHVAEPVAMLRSSQSLRLVSAARDGSRLVDVLRESPFGYVPRGWGPACPGGPSCPPPQCDPTSDPTKCLPEGPQLAASALARTASPPPEPMLVLSASREELFIVGESVDAVAVDGGARRSLALGDVELGTILAATYEMAQDRLFVLDEIERERSGLRRHGAHAGRSERVARLVSIDPSGSGAGVLASWRRASATTRFALGAAQDGRLYLASSGEPSGTRRPVRHTLVSIEVVHHDASRRHAAWDEVITHGVASGDGVLMSHTTYASRFAVSFVVDRGDHQGVASYSPDAPRSRRGECMDDVF